MSLELKHETDKKPLKMIPNRFYIVYNLANCGYSQGIHCTECLPKAFKNAELRGITLSLEERKMDEPRCVFCKDPQKEIPIYYSSYDMDD